MGSFCCKGIPKNEIILNLNRTKKNHIKQLTNDSYSHLSLDNSFCIFNSINNILYLIYANINRSIIAYNIVNNKKMLEIKNAHEEYITNFRYYLDNIKKRDLIISISSDDTNIKIWNINFECLININNLNEDGYLFSACLLSYKNQLYIVIPSIEFIRTFDFNGNQIKALKDYNESIVIIDNFYDNEICINYIITGNTGYIKSYDFNSNKIYYKYCDNDESEHYSIIINDKSNIKEMIETCSDGYIRIWNFHSGELLRRIKTYYGLLKGICLWNKDFLYVGCNFNSIYLIDLNKSISIDEIKGYNAICIKKIIHPFYGDCLIFQGYENNQIQLLININ